MEIIKGFFGSQNCFRSALVALFCFFGQFDTIIEPLVKLFLHGWKKVR